MTARANRSRIALIGSAVVGTLVLAACSSSSGGAASSAVNTDPACAPYKAYMGHSGTTVSMYGSIISPESDSLNKSWAQFSSCTGITIAYEGSNDFESQLPVRVQGGTAPNLAIIPQPGLIAQMVKSGKAFAAPDAVSANVDQYWNKAWKAYSTVDGKFYGAPMSANLKSLVWYSPSVFSAAGYTIPTTWDDLMKLSDTIAAAGKMKPWCGGIGSGTATGWPATDWVEEIVLRQYGPDVYDKWITHDVKFNSPEITGAMNTLNSWMRNPKYVNGGFGDTKTVATTTFQDAGKPILSGKCAMLQQASFYEAQWPKGTTVGDGKNVNAFYLPAMGTQFGNPVEGGGEFVVAFSDAPEVQAVQTYLSTPDWASSRVKVATGWVSANNGVPKELYTDPIDQLSAKYLTDPSATFRFDASDLMPAAVGAGKFWTEMTAWFGENKSTSDVLTAIDSAWPS
ncbi:MAG: ABC transporter substrate-binding protein [Actinomycetes bacterium]